MDRLIKTAFEEDLQESSDVTSIAIFGNQQDEFVLSAKQDGILCGQEYFKKTFHYIDQGIKIEFRFKDGELLQKKDVVARIEGKVSSILTAERTALNIIAHLSGIATKTSEYVHAVDKQVSIMDTRKTLPGLRKLQKYAVKCGGGENHRMGLYDMVMIKDNHIDCAGSITKAVEAVRNKWDRTYKIEVETRNLDDVKEALACRVDIIMLDNMSCEMMKEAVKLADKQVILEASGNVSLQTVQEIAQTGVDCISVGELTHSVKSFDFSLRRGEKR